MQTLTRTYTVVIEDYDHMTTMDVKYELDETNTSIVIIFSNSLGPLLYIYIYFKKPVFFLVHTRGKEYLIHGYYVH